MGRAGLERGGASELVAVAAGAIMRRRASAAPQPPAPNTLARPSSSTISGPVAAPDAIAVALVTAAAATSSIVATTAFGVTSAAYTSTRSSLLFSRCYRIDWFTGRSRPTSSPHTLRPRRTCPPRSCLLQDAAEAVAMVAVSW